MASRARIEAYAYKEGTSFNAAKRALGARHIKGSTHRVAPVDDTLPVRRGPVAGTGKPKGGAKT